MPRLLGLAGLAAGVCCAFLLAGCDRGSHRTEAPAKKNPHAKRAPTRRTPALRLAERRTGMLQAAVQDAAAVTVDRNRALLLGGLTAADTSRPDIRLTTRTHDRAAGAL